jgi:tRNA 5-methylaminomethyl-2-thiouridine biosynthesis bifunctional protein
MSAAVDSWFLDGFSPAKNPAMWSPEIMARLAALSHCETRLSTFTVAGHVRQALTQAGFTVLKTTGFGRKRHRLEARFERGPKKTPPPEIHPVIIGGGIAGASLCRAAKRQGLTPRLIHNDLNMTFAASGNPAAMVKPRLDLQDRPESRFFLASYLYALRAYEDSGAHAILSRGITQIAKHETENARFQKIAAQAPLPIEHLGARANGVYFPRALTINPKAVISDWVGGVDSVLKTAARLSKKGPIWEVQDTSGQLIAASEIMIIASGAGVRDIQLPNGNTIAQDLSLRFSRGQLTWAQGNLDRPAAYGGYAIPLGGDILLGATHDRLDVRDDYALRDADDAHNLEKAQTYLQAYLTGTLTAMKRKGRASLRVTTANTLPQLTEIEDGLWVMTGLGSRGFVFAPLLADHLISRLINKAPSVTPQLWAKLSQNK